MWYHLLNAQAAPVEKFHHYLALPPIGITLEQSSCTYVLTHILAKTTFWITCAFSLTTFQTVVIKIGFLEIILPGEIIGTTAVKLHSLSALFLSDEQTKKHVDIDITGRDLSGTVVMGPWKYTTY